MGSLLEGFKYAYFVVGGAKCSEILLPIRQTKSKAGED